MTKKTVLSAITTIVHLFPYSVSHLQQNFNLSPRHWLYHKDISSLLRCFSKITHGIHWKQTKEGARKPHRRIDWANRYHRGRRDGQEEKERRTSSCYIPDTSGPLHLCWPLSRRKANGNRGQPCGKEPLFFRDVLKAIKSETTGEVRKWTIVGCDGLPYLIGNKVIRQDEDL